MIKVTFKRNNLRTITQFESVNFDTTNIIFVHTFVANTYDTLLRSAIIYRQFGCVALKRYTDSVEFIFNTTDFMENIIFSD